MARVHPPPEINTVAGGGPDKLPALSAALANPTSVAFDSAGNLFIASFHFVSKVDAGTGIITTVAGNGTFGFSGDGGPATSAQLNAPFGVALDSAGHLYIADTGNQRIRKVDAETGIITTVAGNGSFGFSGDGGPATSAQLKNPFSVAPDSAGHLYIADLGNQRIRKVDTGTGIMTTVAGNRSFGFSGDGGPATSAQLHAPLDVALDSAGHLYIADLGNRRIRKVDTGTGIITTVAGNGSFGISGDGVPATSARLASPLGVALDSAGHLYIAENFTHRIRKVDALTGIITTVAGNGSFGFSGDGGPATSAQLNLPVGVALDSADHLYIADLQNRRIRKVVKKEPVELFNDLIALVESFNLQQGIANSLDQKLQNAFTALEATNLETLGAIYRELAPIVQEEQPFTFLAFGTGTNVAHLWIEDESGAPK